MRNRLVKAHPHLHSKHKPDFSIHQDDENDAPVLIVSEPAQAAIPYDRTRPTKFSRLFLHDCSPHRPTLSLASEGAINAAMSRAPANGVNGKALPQVANSNSPQVPARMNSTIRPVRSFEAKDRSSEEDSSTDGMPSPLASRNSAFSSSVNSNASMSSVSQYPQKTNGLGKSSSVRLKQNPLTAIQDGSVSTPEAPKTQGVRQSVEIPQRESSLSAATTNENDPPPSLSATEAQLSNGWDSTVGKAGLGKTGRVINRLVSDNEALKRDIQIERLRAEESKQTARLLEDKLDRIVSEYESRLLEANVTKTLLARKERQVESLQASLELERQRAVDAREREHIWKDELEKVRADSKQKVEDATNYATLMEGRYNAISSHWRDQGEEVKRSVGKMRDEIGNLLQERRKDDDRIETLRDLCDQQDGNIRELRQQKEDIAAQFERYKAEQEEALRAIKTKAQQREEEQERTLRETKEVLDKLRWALNVKEKISWAQ
ncbi:hypothetical protein QBC46DRAFT_40730 [Diplogelasinospora grovesii]|uniref:SWI5-dependent HO expression protein 3 n=1 Tax=Diplogelasinospora grovesii TaxID=303347 RepID=A0AAN6S0H0_9PEZI|nr:hypothetical protein QBC46DRAFT_40730 [Diplogelasinospora grovesii]